MKRMSSSLAGFLAMIVLAAAIFLPQYVLHIREEALYGQLETQPNEGWDFQLDGATLLQRIRAAGTLEISTLDFQVGASLYGDQDELLAQFQKELEALADQMDLAQIILDQLNMAIEVQESEDAAGYWGATGLNLELYYDCVVDATTGRIYILGFLRGGEEEWFELRMDMLSQKIISIRYMTGDTWEVRDWDVWAERLAEYLGLQYGGPVQTYDQNNAYTYEFSDGAQNTVYYVLHYNEMHTEPFFNVMEIYPGASQDGYEFGYDERAAGLFW